MCSRQEAEAKGQTAIYCNTWRKICINPFALLAQSKLGDLLYIDMSETDYFPNVVQKEDI